MDLIDFTARLTGMSRGAIARKIHPSDIGVEIRVIGEGGEVTELPVTRLEYKTSDDGLDIMITHQV